MKQVTITTTFNVTEEAYRSSKFKDLKDQIESGQFAIDVQEDEPMISDVTATIKTS